jgi:hypothetical protein
MNIRGLRKVAVIAECSWLRGTAGYSRQPKADQRETSCEVSQVDYGRLAIGCGGTWDL